MTQLDLVFPGQEAAIARRRRIDTVFDEICRDFDEMSLALTKLESQSRTGTSMAQARDLTASLRGLQEEIAAYLDESV